MFSIPALLMSLMTSLSAEAMSLCPPDVSGTGSGLLNTSRQVGMVVAVATIAGMSFSSALLAPMAVVLAAFALLLFSTWLALLFSGFAFHGAVHLLLLVALAAFPWRSLRIGAGSSTDPS